MGRDITRTRITIITRIPTIATTPIITRVVRSSFTAETTLVPAQGYVWGPVGAVGTVVGGTGYAVGGVFTGAGMIVEGVVGGVLGGVAALFGSPPPSTYAYGAPFAAPFNGAGTVAVAPFQAVGGAFGAPVSHPVY